MKTYHGIRVYQRREEDGRTMLDRAEVTVRDETGQRPLPWRLDLNNHSPTGLEWGYGGSGPAQLALALLADALGDDEAALRRYHEFKDRVVLGLDDVWELTAEQIRGIAAEIDVPS